MASNSCLILPGYVIQNKLLYYENNNFFLT